MIIGIDAGTTCIKTALVTFEGQTIDSCMRNVEVLSSSEDTSEIDMNKLWGKLCSCVLELKQRNEAVWKNIQGIGITGQGDGLWAIDDKGNPVRNAILWNDTRTRHLKLENYAEINKICVNNNANPLYAGSNNHILRWLKEFEADSYKRIHTVFHCKDWLNYKLTGEMSADYSDSTTSVMNLSKKEYSTTILEALDIKESIDFYIEPCESTQVIGKITKTASTQTGLPQGIPVIAGAIDVASVAIGLGTTHIGDTCTIAGTTLGIQTVISDDAIDFDQGLILSHISPESYLCIMPTLNGASTIDWARSLLYDGKSFDEIEKDINQVPLGSNGIIFHPYLMGERAPFKNPYAAGDFFGLKRVHGKKDMMRAVFEGITFSLYDCFEFLPQVGEKVLIAGGASKNDTLCQMAADCLDKAMMRVVAKEAGIKGIVHTVKVGLGIEKDFSSVKISLDKEFKPDAVNGIKYRNLFKMFKHIRTDLEKHWNIRDVLRDSDYMVLNDYE